VVMMTGEARCLMIRTRKRMVMREGTEGKMIVLKVVTKLILSICK
jgi:hypothetical protein